jgi:hypothetical protein
VTWRALFAVFAAGATADTLVIDSGLKMQELFTRDDRRAVMSRVLLLDHGQILLALEDELLMFRNTGLAPLDTGPWPCADGNIHGNPVAARP